MWPLLLNLQNKKILKIIDFGVVKRRFENPQRTQSTLPVFLLVCLAKIQFFSKSKEKERRRNRKYGDKKYNRKSDL